MSETKDGFIPLHAAATFGTASVMSAEIAAGADPNTRDEDGLTPFDCAKDNEALRGIEVYRRLDEARFK